MFISACVGGELQEMCTDEDASDLKEDVDNVNAKYDNVKTAIREKLGELDETLRNTSTDVRYYNKYCVILTDPNPLCSTGS